MRDTLVSILQAGVPQVAGRIYRSRAWPISPAAGPTLEELPALLVYGTPETKRQAEVATVDQRFSVSCDFTVAARAVPPAGAGGPEARLEAALEDLAGTIEAVVLTHPLMIGPQAVIERIAEVRTDLAIEPGNGTLIGSASLTFTLEWSEPWPMDLPITCDDPTVALGLPALSGI
ncbi:MAG: hypothetical protein IRZ07_03775 [Microbispora sp.]|nr:hypothetical protein [Microbispora sp.]